MVGESGCGKTATGKIILRLFWAPEGEALFEGKNMLALDREEMQIIFQDPYTSLNPRMTVGDIVGEPLEIYGVARRVKKEKRMQNLLEVVGLSPYHVRRYPDEFSGGQHQRIGVARGLAVVKHVSESGGPDVSGEDGGTGGWRGVYSNPRDPTPRR